MKILRKQTTMTLHVRFSNNNILLTLVNPLKYTIFSLSSGLLNFKGSEKKKSVAMETLAIAFLQRFLLLNEPCTLLIICFKGISLFRKAFLEMLLKIKSPIKYIHLQQFTGIAHNGCKLPKKRRKK